MNRSHKEGLMDFGASDEYAEEYVKRNVAQKVWIYRFFGVISIIGGSMLFYAVVRTFFNS